MSRIGDIKTNSKTTINIIDYLLLLCPSNKTKYVEMLWKLISSSSSIGLGKKRNIIIDDISKSYNINKDALEIFDDFDLILFKKVLEIFDPKDIELFQKFCNYNEMSLISNNDITKYNNFKDVLHEVNKAEEKINDKETSRQVKKLFENEDWVVIRPLTYSSSVKYGSGTKWCTSSNITSQYFNQYAKDILIYCINKKENIKVAAHKTLYLNDLVFWDQKDNKIDSILSGLPQEILDVVRAEIKTTKGNIV